MLRLVHGDIGATKHLVRPIRQGITQGDSNAGQHGDFVVVNHEWLGEKGVE